MIELHPEARSELMRAIERYERERPGLGAELGAEGLAASAAIEANPNAWSPIRTRRAARAGVRRFVLERFPFTLPFVIREDLIVVLAVAHTRRRPGYWLRRLEGR